MLRHLSIKNVAVIDSAEIDLYPGFTVLTGETGAGKSIIIDAINLLKGERASRALIRSGEAKARVDGEFEVDETTAQAIADIIGCEEADTQIIASREMSTEGKNTIRVNGMPVNLTMLKAIGDRLMNIHGQHDNTALLSEKVHIRFLDAFGGEKTATALAHYQKCHQLCNDIWEQLSGIHTDEQEKLRRRDMLQFQAEEIESAELVPGEEEELLQRKTLLDNAAKISENTNAAYEILYGGEQTASAYDLLWQAIGKLEKIAEYNAELSDIYTALTDAGYIINEKVRALKDFCDHEAFDAEESDSIEKRLETIQLLKKKYGGSIEEILNYYEEISTELENIDSSDEREKQLQKDYEKAQAEREKAAKALHLIREESGKNLSVQIMEQLADLNMKKVTFAVQMEPSEYKSDGADKVEFLIGTNVGEEAKPLSKIASGGELSRIMLAIKNVLVDSDGMRTVVFDEIDTGVSGFAAQKIGEKLFAMSRHAQVMCITHLPQISALADNHYRISKSTDGMRTRTEVTLMTREQRIEEIARTLGGSTITDITRLNAAQLLDEAIRTKENFR